MWNYKSKIGLMCIRFNETIEKYELVINDIVYDYYQFPKIAADDVYCHVTECEEWDNLDGQIADVPTGIEEWEEIN